MKARDLLLISCGTALGAAGTWFFWPSAPAPAAMPARTLAGTDDESTPSGRRISLGTQVAPVASEPAPDGPTLAPHSAGQASGVPKQWADQNHDGIVALEAGDFARAANAFERCLAAVPTERVFAGNLAEALARRAMGEYSSGSDEGRDGARKDLKRAAELAPERTDIRARLEEIEKIARSEEGLWHESSEHFDLSFDGKRDDLLFGSFQITPILERAYQEFGELFGAFPVENGRAKIRVILYARQGFHEATGIGHWAGGLYDGTVRVPIDDLQKGKLELERVLRHEITHAFVASSGGSSVPGWLNEGLAQWLEYPEGLARTARVQGVRDRLKGHTLLPLERLQKSLAEIADEQELGLAYAQGLALVDHLEHHYGERIAFEMVVGCKQKVLVAKTFEERTALTLASVLDELARGL